MSEFFFCLIIFNLFLKHFSGRDMSLLSGNILNARKPIETNADLDQNYNSEHGRIKPCFLIIHNHENIRRCKT